MPLSDVAPESLNAQLDWQQHELQLHQIELELQNQELRRTNSELEDARREYQALFDGAPVGYLVLDEAGFIQRANRTAGQQLGVAEGTLPGRRFSSFIPANEARSFALFLRRLVQTGQAAPLEVSLARTGDGNTDLVVQLQGEAMEHPSGTPIQCRVTLTDITAQRHAQAEVQRLNASLEARVAERTEQLSALNEELETVMYAVSHELLTPLRQARDFGHLLARPEEPEKPELHQHYLSNIEQAMGRMEDLLHGLLQYFRAGQQRLRLRQIDLNQVLTQVRKGLNVQSTADGISFVIDPLPVVYGDSLALQLIFSTLISNAIKFSRTVEATRIRVSCNETAETYVFSVEDNGVGFNMRQKDRLFGMFQRLHSTREFEGLGLGLALVKRFVQRHGGRVWAEGKPGQGATFWFSLPKTQPGRTP
ncbi:sensor histidine kinase [Deinococcus ruber]|uniref:sensor histidine kinase n=1 Tax=Deinococcus ruber TaxID=1848197 RepID=UPI00166AF576|nr:ATP-binding protein [Deinococcus ruber]